MIFSAGVLRNSPIDVAPASLAIYTPSRSASASRRIFSPGWPARAEGRRSRRFPRCGALKEPFCKGRSAQQADRDSAGGFAEDGHFVRVTAKCRDVRWIHWRAAIMSSRP